MSEEETRGAFIVFEGIDGSGKSTQVQLLSSRLRDAGHVVHTTREPTDGPVGSLIRQAMAHRTTLDDRVIAALFVADRLDHLTNPQDGILALLARGVTVISDRYYLSSYAYHAAYVDAEWIAESNSISTSLLRPDVTVFLDLAPKVAVRRMEAVRVVQERYEDISRLEQVRVAYLGALEAAARSEEIVHLPADGSAEDLASEVWASVSNTLEQMSMSSVPISEAGNGAHGSR